MPFVSVTRLRIRSLRFLPGFAYHAHRSRQQASVAPGFRHGALLADRNRTFWTMTVWTDRESMRRYMTSAAHQAAMPHLLDWCDEASVVHWEQPDMALPSWVEADGRMRREGRPSKVRHPSADHATLSYQPPRRIMGGPIPPAKPK